MSSTYNGVGCTNDKDYPSKSKNSGFKAESKSPEYSQVTNSKDYGSKQRGSTFRLKATSTGSKNYPSKKGNTPAEYLGDGFSVSGPDPFYSTAKAK